MSRSPSSLTKSRLGCGLRSRDKKIIVSRQFSLGGQKCRPLPSPTRLVTRLSTCGCRLRCAKDAGRRFACNSRRRASMAWRLRLGPSCLGGLLRNRHQRTTALLRVEEEAVCGDAAAARAPQWFTAQQLHGCGDAQLRGERWFQTENASRR